MTKKKAAGAANAEPDVDFGAAFKAARESKGSTIAEIAREAAISPSMLSRIEAGTRLDLRLTTAARLCRVLGISLDRLLGLSDDFRDVREGLQRLLDRLDTGRP